MASAEREPKTGVWGRSPQRGPEAEPLVPLVRGSGGRQSPPEAETLLAFGRSMEKANLPIFLKSRITENQTFVLSHQCGHRTISFYFYTPSSHIWSVEWNFVSRKQSLSFWRATDAVVSGMHDASVILRSSILDDFKGQYCNNNCSL